MKCPVCTLETETEHSEDDCVEALINSDIFSQFSAFTKTVPPKEKWTEQETEFAKAIALQGIKWKAAELAAE